MPTLAQIKTKKVSLGQLIENSLSIQSLDDATRERLIKGIKKLPKEKQKKVLEILLEEQRRVEEIHVEAAKKLNKTVEDLLLKIKNLEKELERTLRKRTEERERKAEEVKGDELLKKLDS